MKTKSLLFCLLFLVLGTTTALADKYYTVGSRVTGELEIGTGKKYMIYNTTFDGTQDRSGFLYNMGTTFGVQRFRSVDKFICNGAFVFTIEDAGDDDPHTIYLKSLPSNGYLDVDGIQHTEPVKLNLYTWDEARNGDVYTASASGVTLTDNNNIKQACVKSLNAGYTVVTEDKVTSASNAVYVIANEANSWYFNGNEGSYATWTEGHPFAFYECQELESVESFDITDLHIYSRADLFSAHKIYGYIKDASTQITTNYLYEDQGAIENLTDGDFKTFNITNWGYNDANSPHYYQIDLETSVSSLRLYMARRPNGEHAPLNYELWATNTPDGNWTQILDEINTSLDSRLAYTSPVIDLGASYRYIRIQAPGEGNRTKKSEQCLALSELYVLPNREEINNSLPYFDNTLPVAGTELTYKAKVDAYNQAGSPVKTFSGVPVPGNKYRIYADAYDSDTRRYVERYLSIVEENDSRTLKATESYDDAVAGGDANAFYWYCEESQDGKLQFRNAKYPTLYLTNNNTEYVTEDANNAKWSINTNQTQHHGVPLKNSAEQYLTVYNTGAHWMGDVKRVQNQTITTGSANIKNTPDDTTDDIDLTDSKGLCTDFVFLPVDLTEDEVCVTIVASELADRNSKLRVNGVEYEIPFSKVFYNGVPDITLTSTTEGYHNFIGFYNGETNIGSTITNDLYTQGTIESGTRLEARFEIADGKLPELSSGSTTKLYRMKNQRSYSNISQQAGMSRTNIGYENDDDKYTSLENNQVYYYASFVLKNEPLELIYNQNELGASSFFYFTNSNAPDDNEKFCAFINSAVTTLKADKPDEWTNGGAMYYIQPNAVDGENYKGFTITKTMLDADNKPGDAWCSNHSNGNIVLVHNAEDGGSAWEFEEVEEDEAKEELTKHIQLVAKNLIIQLTAKKGTAGIDDDKIDKTIANVQSIAGSYDTVNDTFNTTNAAITTANVTELVSYSQKMQILYNQIEYAMQELPQPTPEAEELSSPKWYYVKNVFSSAYAQYNGANKHMKFSADNSSLSNLFCFAGETVENNTNYEYVKYVEAHIHNFKALNLKETDTKKDSTIVSQNLELFTKDITLASGGQQTQIALSSEETLKNNVAWMLTLEYDLANGAFFNGWGSGLLASGTDAAVHGGTYSTGFQVYLQSSGNIIIRGGDSGSNDHYMFKHTVGAYSKLKIVLSYANKQLQVAVTNSEGVTQTIKDTPKGSEKGRDYIPCESMSNITNLASAMSSASGFSMKADIVVAMKWDTHANNNGKDTWYVLPSSNTTNPGLAIVSNSPTDTEMGWSNVNGEDKEVFTAPGNDNYSTWQFERVTDFTEHIEELFSMYDIANCVIYNKELADLYNTLSGLKAGEQNEATFNAMLKAIREYSGPTPEEFKAPKPGSFYTIRPVEDETTKNALLVHVDKQNTHYATTELYKGVAVDNEGDTDSRAVWMFEGTPESDGFLPLTGLKAKNIHTQTYLGALGADATKLAGTGTAITLAPLGACTTSFKVGDTYMSATGDAEIAYKSGSRFWGYALDEYPSELDGITEGFLDGEVRGKSFEVTVETAGAVTVTFTHNNGSHKLNILGVTLNNAGGILKSVYRHGTAGGNPTTQTYELGNVEPGTYTIHCYVWDCDVDLNSNDDDKVESAQGNITITGISSVASITNTGTENTKWIVEEILDPEADVCYTTTIEDGYSTVMLGFDAKIPTGIEAYYGTNNGFVIDRRYLAMEKYEGNVLPAQAPVVLKSSTEGETMENAKFFYSKIGGNRQDDDYLNGKLWYTIVPVDEGVNLYMLQQDKTGPKMYWIYEEYNAAGDKVSPGADTGGCVACKANKAYILIDNGEAQSNGVFLFSFRPGETTGIYNIADEKYRNENGSVVEGIFDLQGRKLSEITQPGIYIVNGKKVIIK